MTAHKPRTRSRTSATRTRLALKPFQQEDIDALRKHDYRMLIANAPGSGKSAVALSAIDQDPEELTPTIIVAPSAVTENWTREAALWIPDARCHVIVDTTSPIPQDAHLYMVSWSLLTVRYLELVEIGAQLVIADEAHAAKNEDALRTQALDILSRNVPHVILLTGTPLINKVSEMDTLRRLLRVPDDQPIPMRRKLLEDIAPDIPPKTRSLVPVTLRKKDRAEYAHAETEFAEWLETELSKRMGDGMAVMTAQRALAAEALVKFGYLRRLLGLAKVHAVTDWIVRATRMGRPVACYAEHQEVIHGIAEGLRRARVGFVTLDGGTSRSDRQHAIDTFSTRTVPVFLGSKAGGTGINGLQFVCTDLIFAERYCTSAEEEQTEDRIRRIGQRFPTRIWFPHVHGTIDDRLNTIIEAKRQLIHDTIGAFDVEESEEGVAAEIVASWHRDAVVPVQPGADQGLGLAKAIPPIPAPAGVCTLTFRSHSEADARAWAKLHGFPVRQLVVDGTIVRVTVTPPHLFVPGKFYGTPITKDISAVLGVRLPVRRSTPTKSAKRRRR